MSGTNLKKFVKSLNTHSNTIAVGQWYFMKINFKEEFGIVLRQMLRQGVFFGVLRDDGDRYVLQELPSNFCKITGKFNYGLLFDFDFNWFISNYGVDINMYPKVFKKMYREVFENISLDKAIDILLRKN